jgi:hypothetical protein
MTFMTIPSIYKKHKSQNPGSALSLRAIRNACKSGQLPLIQSGNRTLVAWENFEKFLSGNLGSDGNEQY